MEGVGLDIADIGFFRHRPYAADAAFYDLVFTEAERQRCLSQRDPAVGFALCFAVKEAAVKAFSSCGGDLANLSTIQIESAGPCEGKGGDSGDSDDDPPLRLRSCRGETLPALTGLRIRVSYSATKALAAAVVTVSPADARQRARKGAWKKGARA